MRWVSIDVETTGTDINKHDLLEIAAITDNNYTFHGLIKHENIYIATDVIRLHRQLLDELYVAHPVVSEKNNSWYVVGHERIVAESFDRFLKINHDNKKWTGVGKNFGGFTYSFLRQLESKYNLAYNLSYRSIDLGTLFWDLKSELPSSNQLGSKEVNRAMDDARWAHELLCSKLKS